MNLKAYVIQALEEAKYALDISQSLQESAKSNHHPKTLAAYERVSAALALLRSEPALPIKGITRDDTVHGEEYFTRAQVEAMLREPEPTPEPVAGWQWVPKEPTYEMLRAGDHMMDCDPVWVAKGYRAMLAAAPTKGTPSGLR